MSVVFILVLSSVVLFVIATSIPLQRGRNVVATPFKPRVLWQHEAEKYAADICRVQVWDAFADTFLHTRFDDSQFEWLAEIIADSPFSLEELTHILQFEVAPVCTPKPPLFSEDEWAEFSHDILIQRWLKQQHKHAYHPRGNPNTIPLMTRFLAQCPYEGYYLLYRAKQIRLLRTS
jgi:hypothetical protein